MAYSEKPMRRSALIGPWGVGAIVPFPNDESLMIAGLDKWRYSNAHSFTIKDERLQKRLGVKELRWPPDFREASADPENCNLRIPAVRFPRWHYCPFCGYMKRVNYYSQQPECECIQWPDGRKCNPNAKFRRKMIPERFIVVCPEGHVDDFPVAEWLHRNSKTPYSSTCRIRRSTGGTSAALTGVYYQCTCGARESMAGATKPGVLAKVLGYKCRGAKPWLGIEEDRETPCGCEEVKVLLRGATNVWFADTRSSIYIPTDDGATKRAILAILDQFYSTVNTTRVNGEFNRAFIDMLANSHNVDKDELFRAFVRREKGIGNTEEQNEDVSEDVYRFAEYNVLKKSSGGDSLKFHSINHSVTEYNPEISRYFKSISLVPKLKETRAFVGFSRLEPTVKPIAERRRELRLSDDEDWLPAIEVYGEGIFFEFNPDELLCWAIKADVDERMENLRKAYEKSKFSQREQGTLRAEFVLLHTFAHLMINQLSFDCGYGSSALRERIYCEKTSNDLEMYGVLIYTASGDSEGSLGGLVRQGEKGRLEDIILNAIRNAAWCTSDPVCIQSAGQGPESCNLAACHNCALLPETCCECGNRLLDRAMVIGTLKDPDIGFFKELKNR